MAFSLFHPDTGKAVLSDVLFHLTHGVKFSDQTGTDSLASNLLTSEASGTLPLVLSQPRRSITTAHQADEQVSPNGDDAPGEWRERQLPAASRVASS